MQVLANEVAAEAARVGVKFLTAPKDWKATANNRRNYWLEMLSPVHGAGFELSAPFSDWMRFAPKEQSFWEYMRIRPLLNPKHVQYFSGVQAELYRMEFKPDGKLYRVHDGALFDTRGLETCFSGLGWAIFVVSPTGQLYSHKHVEGTFHHSSFLGGSAVMAAGEILVVNGDVRIITAKSGHYKPTPENISNMVKIFPQLPRNAIIFPNFLPDPPPAHTIAEYRFSGNKATLVKRAKVEAKLTGESDNPSSRAWIDKVPA